MFMGRSGTSAGRLSHDLNISFQLLFEDKERGMFTRGGWMAKPKSVQTKTTKEVLLSL